MLLLHRLLRALPPALLLLLGALVKGFLMILGCRCQTLSLHGHGDWVVCRTIMVVGRTVMAVCSTVMSEVLVMCENWQQPQGLIETGCKHLWLLPGLTHIPMTRTKGSMFEYLSCISMHAMVASSVFPSP